MFAPFLQPITATASPTLLSYFIQSNFSGQLIVIALILFSLVAWTLMIGKHLELKRLKSLNDQQEALCEKSGSILALANKSNSFAGPFGFLIATCLNTFYQYQSNPRTSPSGKPILLSHIENALQRSLAKESLNYESKMVILGSIVSGAPFLGLLGTVWGVMDAFGSMALSASSSLQSLAPGVSGALLTTVAGLLVAIPSVFGYNYLLSQTKKMSLELENFASTLADRLEVELDDQIAWQETSTKRTA